MADFSKLINHPEKDKIIGKLIFGESPKDVAQYLKLKFHEKDEAHLRVSANILQEFLEKYLNQTNLLQKVIADDGATKLDKQIALSLVNCKPWMERLEENENKEIDLKKRVQQLIFMLEARAEQVFDKIQENPGSFKGDYVMIKYFDSLSNLIEKADKIINERPDKLVQVDMTINMMQEHSYVFQEAIREGLAEFDPDISAHIMDIIARKFAELSYKQDAPMSVDERMERVERLIPAEIIEDDDDEE